MDTLRVSAAALTIVLSLGSCAMFDAVPKGPTEAFAAHHPASIYVFEPTARSGERGGEEVVRTLIEKGLAKKGYRVGWPADATLYPRVELWSFQAGLFGGSRPLVRVSASLVHGSDGVELWLAKGSSREESDEEDERDDTAFHGLFDAAISSAVDRFISDRAEVAEGAVHELLSSLPSAPDPPR